MHLDALIDLAFEEDIGPGDLTTEACVDPGVRGVGTIKSKQDLVLSGQTVAKRVFERLAQRQGVTVDVTLLVEDGSRVPSGVDVLKVVGPLATLLTGERIALNLLMKLSGIATQTRHYVDALGKGGPVLVDTRKTTPLLRSLEKKAVVHGGARNHRHALYDGVMIKDNHIQAAGGITAAVQAVRARAHHLVRVEVEVESIPELEEAIAVGADVLLLDNMNDERLAEAVARARELDPRVVLEASGNVTMERLPRLRDSGVDFISSGALIHQARWVDLSMRLERMES